jgi:quercetin dioxygenase-like cupin family protein
MASEDVSPPAPATGGVVPVDLRDWVRFDAGAATRVRVVTTGRLALDLWCIQPHQATEVLTLPEADVVYTVLGGRSWFATDDGEVGLDPLGSLTVPAGTVHGIANRAPDPLIVMAVSSPPEQAPDLSAPAASDGRAVRSSAQGGLGRLLTRRRR